MSYSTNNGILVASVIGLYGAEEEDLNEMKAFVGIMMAMGICKLQWLEMYWSPIHCSHPS